MNLNPIILSIPIFLLLIGIELLIQVIKHRKIYRLNDAITNISCGITQQLTDTFVKVIAITGYQFVFEKWSLFNIPINWWSITILFIGVDFCYYWSHRMSHEINLFWGGHVVHHQSEDYNFSVALRQGTFQVLWTFWFYFPLAILGFDTTIFVLIAAFNTIYQFWIHTETISKLPKPIEFIFNTPSHHRVHHGRDPKYIDKNHGGSLIIWDRLFGTFQQEEEQPTYGITKPINTWNPVWANLQHYVDMISQISHTKGWLNKFKIVFNKPGWRPLELGGMQQIPAVNGSDISKYNAHPDSHLSLYVLLQYLITLSGTSLFLFNHHQFNTFTKAAIVALLIWAVAQLGVLLENRQNVFKYEYMRIFTSSLIVCFLFPSLAFQIIIFAFACISIAGFYFSSKTFKLKS